MLSTFVSLSINSTKSRSAGKQFLLVLILGLACLPLGMVVGCSSNNLKQRPIAQTQPTINELMEKTLSSVQKWYKNSSSNIVQLYKEGIGCISRKQWKDGIDLFTSIIKTYPSGPHCTSTFFWLGYCFEQSGEKDKAIALYNSIVKIGSSNHILNQEAKRRLKELR